MIWKIYHGSKSIIQKPVFGFGSVFNDYGLGFYCTNSIDMAKEWGVSEYRNGYANIYDIQTDGLTILDLNSKDLCILHWLTVLLKNRTFEESSVLAHEAKEYLLSTFLIDYSAADIIIGYRADDSYFSFAEDFINGTISYRQLGNAMRLGKLGQQIVLKSEEAFNRIVFKGYEVALCDEWYEKKIRRDTDARKQYFDVERNRRQKGDLYITSILDEEMKPDDPRLR